MENIELWKTVPHVLHTEASDLGRIRRINPITGLVTYPKGHYDRDGYIKYSTSENIIRKKKQSERLDNQQPNLYSSIWGSTIEGGSTTIISSSKK